LAQWLVVDSELLAFLELFDGRRPVKHALRTHAKRWRKNPRQVAAEAKPLLKDLCTRQILASTGSASPHLPADTISIANVTLNLTNRCNLKCPWCYNAGRSTGEMEADLIMDAVEAGRGLLSRDSSFIVLGGEPLLRPERLCTVLKRAQGIFPGPTLISTNGTMISQSVARRLADFRVEVQISLDSHRPDRHDDLRGRGTFDRAIAGVRRLVDGGVYTLVSMVFNKDNYQEMEDYLEMALNLGVREARFIPMRAIGRGRAFAHLAPDPLVVFEHLMEILGRRPELSRLLARDYFSIFMSLCRYSTIRTNCGIGRKVVFIDSDGKVYPCPNHVSPSHLCGDLQHMGLEEIVRSSPAMNLVRKQYHIERFTRCRTCPFRHWCAGDCRGEVLSVTGNPLAPAPKCEELQSLFKRMLWMIAEGDNLLGMDAGLPESKIA
jgi:radical SAM protein with 4Fe4S-binding SPASM domain